MSITCNIVAVMGILPKYWIESKDILLSNISNNSKAKSEFNLDWCHSKLSWLEINNFKMSNLKLMS